MITINYGGSMQTCEVFQNGILRAKLGSMYQSDALLSSAILIGMGGFNRDRGDNALDEVRIYNRVLSPQEVVSLYTEQAGGLLPVITSTNSFQGKVGVSTNWTVTASGSTPIIFRGTNTPA